MTEPRELPPGAKVGAGDIVEAAGHPVGGGLIKDPLRPAADQRGPGAAGQPDLVVLQHLRVLDVRRAQRRRLRHGRQPVRARPRQLAGADRTAGRHHHRLLPVQPGGQAQPAGGCSLSGGVPQPVRRARGQHPRDHPWPHRRGVVRHPDLPSLGRTGRRAAQAVPRLGPLRRRRPVRLHGSVPARLGQLHAAVDPAGRRVLARYGVDPQVHRLLRTRRLRRDVHPVRLPAVEVRLARQPEPGWREEGQLAGHHARRDRAGGVLLLRSDAELRRLRPLRQELQGGEEGQLPRPAGQLPGVLAAGGHHRGRDGPGVRRTAHRPGSRPSPGSTA